ncbi:MAG: Prephenate and/or arogenate dehydrogenase (unknown specificity)(EC [uncultured Thermomicrobiales bacterium]|uniref:Prephenate/arogenate dehydrogenase domain-containing protein n=1 Tax=uncultured Thermomicrobiales bacterium TaxID=1645740 RepID=A0A6J4UU61_9BACT|nr:MAG: Prephenate and/or arogenate dehydrogenase (unknown specificity)(EC [uncultured Thermomicrobiales bacterium]
MQSVTIIGLGLIGGSIGLGLRRWSSANGDALRIVGFDENIDKQSRAKAIGAVDAVEWSLAKSLSNADVVIVATPVGAMSTIFEDIGPHLKQGAVVTDTGSTKADVLDWARTLPSHVDFIGGHPMAGRSESLEAADADLFTGATWVVCPSVTAAESSVRTVLGIIAAVGADAFFVDPTEHDSYVAGISHLPFVVAASLMETVANDQAWRDMKTLSATGLRDTTRLALGNPQMHRDILHSNSAAISRWIDSFTATLQNLKTELEAGNEEAADSLLAFFTKAQDDRASLEVVTSRVSEQATLSAAEMSKENVSEQMGRMFLGGLGRRRAPRNPKS